MTFVPLDPAGAVSSKCAKGTGGPAGDEAYNLVGHVFPIQNALRGKSQNGMGVGMPGDPMYTLDGASQHAVALGFDWYASASQSLTPADVSPPLKTAMQPAVAYQCQGSNVGEMGTLRAGNGGVTGGVPFVPVAFDMQQVTSVLNRQRLGSDRPCPTLHQAGGAHVITDMAVRRLTPTECERLQGFPDDWTVPAGSDSARYKALGNAVAVPVVERIGRQIVSVLL